VALNDLSRIFRRIGKPLDALNSPHYHKVY
jgi:hypothetical protein